MPKYLTWEKAKQRFVFQMRIPAHAKEFFGGKTTLRIHLGNIPLPEATTRAVQLEIHYKTLIAKLKEASEHVTKTVLKARFATHLLLDACTAAQMIATWKTQMAHEFQRSLNTLRQSTNETWKAMAQELEESRCDALEQLRRQDTATFKRAIQSTESRINVRFDGIENISEAIIWDFNSAYVAFLKDCTAVLEGDAPIRILFPEKDEQLPLTDLWGESALDMFEHWQSTVKLKNGYVNPKTADKYQRIAADLEFILHRRPIQDLVADDLNALIYLWRNRGNVPVTIKGKLDILKCMLKPYCTTEYRESLFTAVVVGPAPRKASRLPFTDEQLRRFTTLVLESGSIRQDDKMLLALMLLLSARLEEICQLHASDFEDTELGWVIRIADHRQTGHGETRLKNDTSARRLPLLRDIIPGLDHWLSMRISSGGAIFPDMRPNKYGQRGSAASKRLNRLLRTLFPDDRRLVLQSTRNTASRIMRRANVDSRVRRRYLGHADVGIHDRHYDPGELLDDYDLQSGSTAISERIRVILGIQDGPTV